MFTCKLPFTNEKFLVEKPPDLICKFSGFQLLSILVYIIWYGTSNLANFYSKRTTAHNAAVLPVIPLTASYTIPVTISVLTPGVAVHAPVAASCVKDAAGTVTWPLWVTSSPVVSL